MALLCTLFITVSERQDKNGLALNQEKKLQIVGKSEHYIENNMYLYPRFNPYRTINGRKHTVPKREWKASGWSRLKWVRHYLM